MNSLIGRGDLSGGFHLNGDGIAWVQIVLPSGNAILGVQEKLWSECRISNLKQIQSGFCPIAHDYLSYTRENNTRKQLYGTTLNWRYVSLYKNPTRSLKKAPPTQEHTNTHKTHEHARREARNSN